MQSKITAEQTKRREYYCTRVLREFCKTWNFYSLEEIIDENCKICTRAIDRIQKLEVINYYIYGLVECLNTYFIKKSLTSSTISFSVKFIL